MAQPPVSSSLAGVLRLHYFYFFASLGIYVPYLPEYLRERGFDGFEIGLLGVLLPATKTLLPPFVGPLADRLRSPLGLIRLAAAGTFVAALLLVLLPGRAGIVAALAVFAVFRAPAPPLVDAVALRHLPDVGDTFGRARLVGSAGFALVALGAGPILDRVGIEATPWMLLALLAGVVWAAARFPDLPAPPPGPRRSAGALLRENPVVVRVLGCAFLHCVAGTAFSQFFTLHVVDLGHAKAVSGLGWMLGVAVEIAFLHVGHRVLDRTGAVPALLAAFAVSALRWHWTASAVTAPALIAIQALHGFTFGVFFLASVTFVQEQVAPGESATAQSLFSAASFGLGSIVGNAASGAAFEAWGGARLFELAAGVETLALVAGVLLLVPWRPGGARRGPATGRP